MRQLKGRVGRARVMDAGGARARAAAREADWAKSMAEAEASRKRVSDAAGNIPVLKTVKQVQEYTGYVPSDMFGQRNQKKLLFPVLQVSPKLSLEKVFESIAQSHQKQPNVVAKRHEEDSVGPHFDDYARGFMPWTLHENLEGVGTIRAAFISREAYAAYHRMADLLPDGENVELLLAQNRAALGAAALASAGRSGVYTGKVSPGTRTLIWHGDHLMPPAAHEIVRDEPGSYRVYAHQYGGEPVEGFQAIPTEE